jgi:hypothetical protein
VGAMRVAVRGGGVALRKSNYSLETRFRQIHLHTTTVLKDSIQMYYMGASRGEFCPEARVLPLHLVVTTAHTCDDC